MTKMKFLTALNVLIVMFCYSSLHAQTVTIGTQVWSTKNLDVSTFRNGDVIPQAKTDEEWKKAGVNKQPAWCYYNNDPANGEKYGKLYNWYAVNDPRGLAPTGFHIPSKDELNILIEYLGGKISAGAKLKNKFGWNEEGNGSNSSGFSALSGGSRFIYNQNNQFEFVGEIGSWWSSSERYEDNAWELSLYYTHGQVDISDFKKGNGCSVRCISNNSTNTENSSSNNFKTITIGKQVWMSENLNVEKFRNGDPIPEAKTDEEWKKAGENKQPAWCYYNNDPANGEKYGKLYNWYAVNDLRGLAPEGWHVPSDEEWTILLNYLGGEEVAGAKLKSQTGWVEDGNGTNISCFLGFPGGYRVSTGKFFDVGYNASWWSSTEMDTEIAWYRTLFFYDDWVYRFDRGVKRDGYSVRCLKD
jgi:uncharacterized protein (TIGR02145 family)